MSPVTTDWMNPLNKLRWQAAIKSKAKTVTMLDGAKFKLTHTPTGIKFEPVATGTTKALVPRGTFDRDLVLSDEWLD